MRVQAALLTSCSLFIIHSGYRVLCYIVGVCRIRSRHNGQGKSCFIETLVKTAALTANVNPPLKMCRYSVSEWSLYTPSSWLQPSLFTGYIHTLVNVGLVVGTMSSKGALSLMHLLLIRLYIPKTTSLPIPCCGCLSVNCIWENYTWYEHCTMEWF